MINLEKFNNNSLELYINSINNSKIKPLRNFQIIQYISMALICLIVISVVAMLYINEKYDTINIDISNNMYYVIIYSYITISIISVFSFLYTTNRINKGITQTLQDYLGVFNFSAPNINIKKIIKNNNMLSYCKFNKCSKQNEITYSDEDISYSIYMIELYEEVYCGRSDSGHSKHEDILVFQGVLYKISAKGEMFIDKNLELNSDIKIISNCQDVQSGSYYILAGTDMKMPRVPFFITENTIYDYCSSYINKLSLIVEPMNMLEFR